MKNSLFITELYDSSKTNYVRYWEAFMANLNRKERRAQRNESNTIGYCCAYSLDSALSAWL